MNSRSLSIIVMLGLILTVSNWAPATNQSNRLLNMHSGSRDSPSLNVTWEDSNNSFNASAIRGQVTEMDHNFTIYNLDGSREMTYVYINTTNFVEGGKLINFQSWSIPDEGSTTNGSRLLKNSIGVGRNITIHMNFTVYFQAIAGVYTSTITVNCIDDRDQTHTFNVTTTLKLVATPFISCYSVTGDNVTFNSTALTTGNIRVQNVGNSMLTNLTFFNFSDLDNGRGQTIELTDNLFIYDTGTPEKNGTLSGSGEVKLPYTSWSPVSFITYRYFRMQILALPLVSGEYVGTFSVKGSDQYDGAPVYSPQVDLTMNITFEINGSPTISNVNMEPVFGNESTTFEFSADFADPEDDPLTTWITVDGTNHSLVDSSYTATLVAGMHRYQFFADDGLNQVYSSVIHFGVGSGYVEYELLRYGPSMLCVSNFTMNSSEIVDNYDISFLAMWDGTQYIYDYPERTDDSFTMSRGQGFFILSNINQSIWLPTAGIDVVFPIEDNTSFIGNPTNQTINASVIGGWDELDWIAFYNQDTYSFSYYFAGQTDIEDISIAPYQAFWIYRL